MTANGRSLTAAEPTASLASLPALAGMRASSPLPSAFFCMLQNLLRKAEIGLRPRRRHVIHKNRRAMAWGFGQRDVSRDDGVEHLARKILTYFFSHLPIE